MLIREINDLSGRGFFFIPLYEQEPIDQVGAAIELLLEVPEGREVQKVDICFIGFFVPHFGHTGGAWVDESSRWSNFSPHLLHLYS